MLHNSSVAIIYLFLYFFLFWLKAVLVNCDGFYFLVGFILMNCGWVAYVYSYVDIKDETGILICYAFIFCTEHVFTYVCWMSTLYRHATSCLYIFLLFSALSMFLHMCSLYRHAPSWWIIWPSTKKYSSFLDTRMGLRTILQSESDINFSIWLHN